uniref:Replication restart protein PriA n=1 Tax=candidate division CPR3 bacterium TaxID=2268181 RepID=A0A7C4M2M6_UNCC3
MFCDLALNTKSSKRDDLFTYSIPVELEDTIMVGQMVIAPIGSRKINGIVVKIHDKKPDFETKNIEKIIDPIPLINEKQVELARFISEHYWCGFSQALFTFLPANLRKRKTSIFKKEKDIGYSILDIKENKNKNIKYPISNISNLVLTSQQEKAFDKISKSLESNTPSTFLLHGVTNSGKTEVYLRACAKALVTPTSKVGDSPTLEVGVGGSCIFIIPEIALTPQSVKRFEEVFGKKRIALVHSKLSIAQRLKTWIDIKTGKKDIVIGSRSAIFAPLPNLRLIIVDEEHDLISFKSDQTPRYELHVVAEKLAEINNATLVFGSATPLVTSYKRVIDGEWEYLSMQERVDKSIPPQIKVINMEEEKKSGNSEIFSEYLIKALDMVLKNKKQALLFLNHRGMASFIICNDCKKISMCENCDSALVHHYVDNKLWCHHCGRKYQIPVQCDACGGLDFRFLGRGTERIEFEIKRYFPNARVSRMDRDTMNSDEAYQNIFEKYKKGEIDILVGTQMIVHGWDIPSVDLAAVLSIDESLLMPDYLSEEKVFQLITQLAGRTGRSSARGMLVLQTINPEAWVFDVAIKNDYLSFAKRELSIREKFNYPPYGELIKLSLGGVKKEVIGKKADELVERINHLIIKSFNQKEANIEVIGPISPLIEKKYGKYWKTIVIKLKSNTRVENFLPLRDDLLNIVPKEWGVDVDPISLL